MSEYSQGVREDGAVILKDGQPMVIEEIVEALNRLDRFESSLFEMNPWLSDKE